MDYENKDHRLIITRNLNSDYSVNYHPDRPKDSTPSFAGVICKMLEYANEIPPSVFNRTPILEGISLLEEKAIKGVAHHLFNHLY